MSTNYPLHEFIYNNDQENAARLLETQKEELFENLKDCHGNTPLHIAVMLGHKECVELLIQHQHPIGMKNAAGWTSIQEAVSYGNKSTITSLFRALNEEKKLERAKRKPEITKALNSFIGDFYVKMVWDFQSWLPFISRVLPSDVCQIFRKGKKVRMNSTLEDFADRHWVRGDLSYILNFEGEGDAKVYLLDNKKKFWYQIQQQSQHEKQTSVEENVNVSMCNDISDSSIKTNDFVVERMSSGWIFRRDKTENIGQFAADFYKLSGLSMVTRKRREHLSDDDIKKNKLLREAFNRGENTEKLLESCNEGDNLEPRTSLPKPPPSSLTWEEYIQQTSKDAGHLGRPKREKTSHKDFEATLGISPNFPIKLEDLLPILESLGPKAKIFSKLRDFITLHLPPGFPVRIDLPIFPTVKAVVSFPEFELRNNLPDSMFVVPPDYKELPQDYFDKKLKKKPTLSH